MDAENRAYIKSIVDKAPPLTEQQIATLRALFVPHMPHWRLRLSCGCTPEVVTWSETAPTQYMDHASEKALPEGQVLCAHDDDPPAEYRKIVEWLECRKTTVAADSVAPPDWWTSPPDGLSPELWERTRLKNEEVVPFWTVRLDCGHHTRVPAMTGWKPADGPRLVSPDRAAQMVAEIKNLLEEDPDDRDLQYHLRMAKAGWPRPAPEELCFSCSHVKTVKDCRRVGEPAKPKVEPAPDRAALEAQLRRAEAQAERLRRKIEKLDT